MRARRQQRYFARIKIKAFTTITFLSITCYTCFLIILDMVSLQVDRSELIKISGLSLAHL